MLTIDGPRARTPGQWWSIHSILSLLDPVLFWKSVRRSGFLGLTARLYSLLLLLVVVCTLKSVRLHRQQYVIYFFRSLQMLIEVRLNSNFLPRSCSFFLQTILLTVYLKQHCVDLNENYLCKNETVVLLKSYIWQHNLNNVQKKLNVAETTKFGWEFSHQTDVVLVQVVSQNATSWYTN